MRAHFRQWRAVRGHRQAGDVRGGKTDAFTQRVRAPVHTEHQSVARFWFVEHGSSPRLVACHGAARAAATLRNSSTSCASLSRLSFCPSAAIFASSVSALKVTAETQLISAVTRNGPSW
jgi:hypothetical protein